MNQNFKEKFDWIFVHDDSSVEVSEASLETFFYIADQHHDLSRKEVENLVNSDDAIFLKSSDGINYQRVKLLAPKDDWSVVVWGK